MTDARTGVYWMGLSDLQDDVLLAAAQECVRESTFFPTIAELRQRAIRLLEEAGALPLSADEAWNIVMERVRRWMPGASTRFDEPNINQAVKEMGGLGYIAMVSDEQVGYIRRDFVARYNVLRQRTIHSRSLPGFPQPLVVHEDVPLEEQTRKPPKGAKVKELEA